MFISTLIVSILCLVYLLILSSHSLLASNQSFSPFIQPDKTSKSKKKKILLGAWLTFILEIPLYYFILNFASNSLDKSQIIYMQLFAGILLAILLTSIGKSIRSLFINLDIVYTIIRLCSFEQNLLSWILAVELLLISIVSLITSVYFFKKEKEWIWNCSKRAKFYYFNNLYLIAYVSSIILWTTLPYMFV